MKPNAWSTCTCSSAISVMNWNRNTKMDTNAYRTGRTSSTKSFRYLCWTSSPIPRSSQEVQTLWRGKTHSTQPVSCQQFWSSCLTRSMSITNSLRTVWVTSTTNMSNLNSQLSIRTLSPRRKSIFTKVFQQNLRTTRNSNCRTRSWWHLGRTICILKFKNNLRWSIPQISMSLLMRSIQKVSPINSTIHWFRSDMITNIKSRCKGISP